MKTEHMQRQINKRQMCFIGDGGIGGGQDAFMHIFQYKIR